MESSNYDITQERAAVLLRETPALTRALVDRFVAEIPFYALLPAGELTNDVAAIVAENISVFAAGMRDGHPPTTQDVAVQQASAARRALEGVPLEAVLTAYYVGARAVWQELAAGVERSDDVAKLADVLLSYLARVSGAVAAAYLDERQSIFGAQHEARRELFAALLAGTAHDQLARAAAVRVPARYVVINLLVGTRPDESAPPPAGSIASHRELRRVQEVFEKFAGEPVLSTFEAKEVTALLPADCVNLAHADEARRERLAQLMSNLSSAADAEIAGAAEVADVDQVGATVTRAREVARLVKAFGLPPGFYDLRDVALEYQLTRSTAASGLLAGLLDPIGDRPELLVTLQSYLAHDMSRKATAAGLHVHPNTLDYRLRRIADLTGLDVTCAAGLHRIVAAITARAIVRTSTPGNAGPAPALNPRFGGVANARSDRR